MVETLPDHEARAGMFTGNTFSFHIHFKEILENVAKRFENCAHFKSVTISHLSENVL